MRAKALEDLVKHLEYAPVECDGMARLVATVLTQHKVAYQGMAGTITPKGCDYTIPHFWVQVGELVIDYRAQMWLGDGKDIPTGWSTYRITQRSIRASPFSLIHCLRRYTRL